MIFDIQRRINALHQFLAQNELIQNVAIGTAATAAC